MKLIWCKQRKTWVEPSEMPKRGLHVISDFSDPVESPITGEAIHSKGAYYKHLQTFGYHVSEAGDVAKRSGPDREGVRRAVKRACDELGV